MAAKYAKPPFSPTRFPAGITNANVGDVLGNYALPDPTKMQTFFEDFITPPAALGTFTGIAGAGGLATVATTNAVGTPTASFRPISTRRAFFAARLSLATVANTIRVGFAPDLSSDINNMSVTVANNVLTLRCGAATVTANVATVNATMYELGIVFVPRDGLYAYLDGAPVARLDNPTLPAADMVAGILPTGATATVDYIFAAVER